MISGVTPSAITIPSSFGRQRAVVVVSFCAVVAVVAYLVAWAKSQGPMNHFGFAVYLLVAIRHSGEPDRNRLMPVTMGCC
jgi:hypothetical protein